MVLWTRSWCRFLLMFSVAEAVSALYNFLLDYYGMESSAFSLFVRTTMTYIERVEPSNQYWKGNRSNQEIKFGRIYWVPWMNGPITWMPWMNDIIIECSSDCIYYLASNLKGLHVSEWGKKQFVELRGLLKSEARRRNKCGEITEMKSNFEHRWTFIFYYVVCPKWNGYKAHPLMNFFLFSALHPSYEKAPK